MLLRRYISSKLRVTRWSRDRSFIRNSALNPSRRFAKLGDGSLARGSVLLVSGLTRTEVWYRWSVGTNVLIKASFHGCLIFPGGEAVPGARSLFRGDARGGIERSLGGNARRSDRWLITVLTYIRGACVVNPRGKARVHRSDSAEEEKRLDAHRDHLSFRSSSRAHTCPRLPFQAQPTVPGYLAILIRSPDNPLRDPLSTSRASSRQPRNARRESARERRTRLSWLAISLQRSLCDFE